MGAGPIQILHHVFVDVHHCGPGNVYRLDLPARFPSWSSAGRTADDTRITLLTLKGKTERNLRLGQAINLHGDHFGTTDTITFLLDTTSPLTGAGGKPIATRADNQEAFDVALTIGSDWTTGTHTVEGPASRGNQDVIPYDTGRSHGHPATTSPDLSVTTGGKPVQTLTFKALAGNRIPPETYHYH